MSENTTEEHRVNGKLQGWTGRKCIACNGVGERYSYAFDCDRVCPSCAGTGEEYGDVE